MHIQKLEKIMETLQKTKKIILIRCWSTFSINYSLYSTRYWFVQIMNCFQRNFTPFFDQNFFEFFKRQWGGNRLLTYSSKTDHKCSIILRSEDCEGQARCSASSECSSCHSLTILVVYIEALSSRKHYLNNELSCLKLLNNFVHAEKSLDRWIAKHIHGLKLEIVWKMIHQKKFHLSTVGGPIFKSFAPLQAFSNVSLWAKVFFIAALP